jgi:hypothetical protein
MLRCYVLTDGVTSDESRYMMPDEFEQAQREAKLATDGKWSWIPADDVIYLSIPEAIALLHDIGRRIEFQEFCEILKLQPQTDNLATRAAWRQFKVASQVLRNDILAEQWTILLSQALSIQIRESVNDAGHR